MIAVNFLPLSLLPFHAMVFDNVRNGHDITAQTSPNTAYIKQKYVAILAVAAGTAWSTR